MTDRTVAQEREAGAPRSDGGSGRSGRRYVYRCQLRWADFDAFRHVNNVRYLELFQDARIDFANAMLPDPERLEAATVVARQEVDYLLPLHYRPGTVDVPIWVTRMGSSSVTVAFQVVDRAAPTPGLKGPDANGPDAAEPDPGVAARVYARGSCVIVGYDLSAARSRRFTDLERTIFAAIADPELPGPG